MRKNESGQSVVEMALVLPILLLLLVGILDFGRILYSYAHLHIAAQETVRIGALGRGDAEIQQFAKNYIHLGKSDQLKVTVSPLQANRKPGGYLTVKLQYPLELYTPLLANFLPLPKFIVTDSTIRVE